MIYSFFCCCEQLQYHLIQCKNVDSQGLSVSSLHLYTILASSLYLEMGLSVLSVHQP